MRLAFSSTGMSSGRQRNNDLTAGRFRGGPSPRIEWSSWTGRVGGRATAGSASGRRPAYNRAERRANQEIRRHAPQNEYKQGRSGRSAQVPARPLVMDTWGTLDREQHRQPARSSRTGRDGHHRGCRPARGPACRGDRPYSGPARDHADRPRGLRRREPDPRRDHPVIQHDETGKPKSPQAPVPKVCGARSTLADVIACLPWSRLSGPIGRKGPLDGGKKRIAELLDEIAPVRVEHRREESRPLRDAGVRSFEWPGASG